MLITVFTPTYNRESRIKNLYNSLKTQSFADFEWLIVDDGSTDNTEIVVQSFIKEQVVNIRYIKQSRNKGKHVAINIGIENARGQWFFIVDSDDWLPPDSLETIVYYAKNLPKSGFCGIAGLRGFDPDTMQGTTFSDEYMDALNSERSKYQISGDKAEVFLLEVLKQYKFPVFENENFVTEDVLWDKMAEDGYLIRYFNKIIYCAERLPDGLSSQGIEKYIRNPKGWGVFIAEKRRNRKTTFRQYADEVRFYYKSVNQLSTNEKCEALGIKKSELVKYIWISRAYALRHMCYDLAKKSKIIK